MLELSLTRSRGLRFLVFAALYAAQGIPVGFISVAIYAWLAEQGVTTRGVATIAAVAGVPWAIKLLWGPLVDRYQYPALGRRRPWIMGVQLCLVIAALVPGLLQDPLNQLLLLTMCLFAQAICASLQDVAVDAMAIDVFPAHELGRANAFMFGGKILGYAVGAAALSSVLAKYGLRTAALCEAAALALLLLVIFSVRERLGEKLLPWSEGKAQVEASPFRRQGMPMLLRRVMLALATPSSVRTVIGMALAISANTLVAAVFKVFVVQELGWRSTELTFYVGVYGAAAALLGAAGVALLADRVGHVRLLSLAVLSISLLSLLFGLNESAWAERRLVEWFLIVDALFVAAAVVGINTLCMDLCAPEIGGTQYAVYMAVFNAAVVAGNALAAFAGQWFSMPTLFLLLAGINVLAVLVICKAKLSEAPARDTA